MILFGDISKCSLSQSLSSLMAANHLGEGWSAQMSCVFTAILIKGDRVAWTNHGGNNRSPRHFEL